MSEHAADTFRLAETYAFLEDGGAAPLIPGGGAFWTALMRGPPYGPELQRVTQSGGWLLAQYTIATDSAHWERHPAGDELLVMLSGSMDVVLEFGAEHRTIAVLPGDTVRVPAGVWHRQLLRTVGTYVGITYGRGTEHRPLIAAGKNDARTQGGAGSSRAG
jgi:mannose-6-phosphate isomerase-like protein (cupin superfamily)